MVEGEYIQILSFIREGPQDFTNLQMGAGGILCQILIIKK